MWQRAIDLMPYIKGDNFSITNLGDEYLAGVDACKHNLHERIIWP